MSFSRPALKLLIDRVLSDIDARLPGASSRLPFSNLNVLGTVHAGGVHGLYGYIEYLAKQIFPDTAESEYLDRFLDIYDIPRLEAAAASGLITITGSNGSTAPTGTLFQRADGAQFQTTADATIASSTANVNVIAVVAGAAGNSVSGTQLNLVSPVPGGGVNTAATVGTDGLVNGADQETDEAARARLLNRIRKPPQGGSKADYITWAKEVPGVTRAWTITPGDGTVTVLFVRDNDVSIIPDAGEVATVQAHIDAVRPLGATPYVIAPTPVAMNFTIALTPNTVAVQNAVKAELTDLLLQEGAPGATIYLSHIRAAVSQAAGETDSVVTVPSANVTHTATQMPVIGSFTWV